MPPSISNSKSQISNPKSYVAYLRDSGGDTQDLSTSEQALAVQRWCAEHNHTLITIYVDDATPGSSTIGRTQFQALIRDLRAQKYPGCAGVLIWSYSRFSRDIDDSQFYKSDLRRRGYQIVSLTDQVPDGSMGRLFEAAIDWKNATFLENLSTDVRRGLYHLVETIGAVPGTPPRGFTRTPVPLPDRRDGQPHIVHRWDPDPAWEDRIRLAFEMRAAGASYAAVQRATGIYRNKNSWSHFFANQLYMGTLQYGELTITNYCRPIISPALFATVQAIEAPKPSADNPIMHPRRLKTPYLLSGIIYCTCGAALSGSTVTSTTKGWRKRYYACTRASRTHRADCQARLIPADVIENNLIEFLRSEILTLSGLHQLIDEILAAAPPILEETQARLTVIGQRLAELKRSLDRLTDAILDAGHSPQLIARLKALETEQAKLQAEQTALHATLTDLTTRPTDEQLERMIRQLGPALETGEPALVRSIILRLISRITAERLDDTIVANVIYILPTGISHRGGSSRTQNWPISPAATPAPAAPSPGWPPPQPQMRQI